MNVKFTPKAKEGHILLSGEFTQASALALRDAIREAREYWHYDRLTLQINSPGGELLALKAIMHEIRLWRSDRRKFATEALMKSGSAAALALSMGDVGNRRVQPYTELLYHHTRMMADGQFALTAHHAEEARQQLRQADLDLLRTLVSHIAAGYGGMAPMARAGLLRCQWAQQHAESIGAALGRDSGLCIPGRSAGKKPTPMVPRQIERAYQKAATANSSEPVIELLATLFDRDSRMPVDVAWVLLLIDEVDSVHSLQPDHKVQSAQSGHRPRMAA